MKHVRISDLCDVDFAPGKELFPVAIEGTPRLLAPHEVEQMQLGIKSNLLNRRALFGFGALGAAALLLRPDFAFAANRTAWTAGNGVGYTWATAIASANMASMANTQSVLDSTDQTNQTAQDLLADISISLIIASSTIVAGANIAIWEYYLNQDGTTYGDNHLTTTAATVTPSAPPNALIPCFAAATQTSIIGNATGLVMVPGTLRWAMQDNSGFSLTAGTQAVKYRTYNTNLNN